MPKTLDKTGMSLLSRLFTEGMSQNMTNTELINFLRERTKSIAQRRGELIVETELITAMNLVETEVYKRNGIKKVVWRTAEDEKVEAICIINEKKGAIVLGEAFPSGHISPPGHSRCRCFLVPFISGNLNISWIGA